MELELWRQRQKESFSKISDVIKFLNLDAENQEKLIQKPHFPFLLPRRIASKIPKNNLDNPLAKQFIPLKDELISHHGFLQDPTCDVTFQKERKILHKYHGRVLLITTGACAMHCRYCFRQNFSYPDGAGIYQKEMEYIQNDSSIHEIILSGGDPLSLSDTILENLISDLNKISHLRIIRFHTRFLIGIPERISPAFLNILQSSKKQIVFVQHSNHFDEFDSDTLFSLKQIQHLGIPVLLQTVLLQGVNDNLESLKTLFLNVCANGIIPYYLHKLDKVKGTSHFYLKKDVGTHLIEELRKSLPGYAVPRHVEEIPNAPYKTLLI